MFDEARQLGQHDGGWNAVATADWYQGRGAYGGLQGAWLLDALRRHPAAQHKPIRTLSIQCCAPVVAGPVHVEVALERAGASVAYLSARLRQGDQVAATALATFGAPRAHAPEFARPAAPAVPPPDALRTMPGGPQFPAFTQHVEYRYALGSPPVSASARAHLGGWARFRGGAAVDEVMLMALSDVWPPAILSTFDRMRGLATMDWTTSFLHPLDLSAFPPDAWWLYEVDGGAATDGYALQTGRVFTPDGRCVIEARQTVAVLG